MRKEKTFTIITIVLMTFILTVIPAMGAESLDGYFEAQAVSECYEFSPDGSVIYNGTEGIYTISGDELTIIAGGFAYKYTYEMIGDKLILYGSEGPGVVFDREYSETETPQDQISEGLDGSLETADKGLLFDLSWGMSMDEVRELVPEELEETMEETALSSTIFPEEGDFSMTGHGFYFEDGGLLMIVSMCSSDEAFDSSIFEKLNEELCAVYGEAGTAEEEYVVRVMSKADEEYEPELASEASIWEDGQGTQILLAAEAISDHRTFYYTIYLSPAYVEAITQ